MIQTWHKLRKIKRNSQKLIVVTIVGYQLAFPFPSALAAGPTPTTLPNFTVEASATDADLIQLIAPIRVEPPVATQPEYQVVATHRLTITAYSSTVDQTDSTPCITANGYNLCEHDEENVIAANFLPFGTKVRIPEYFGDRIFTVQDRMNARYTYRADVWMRERSDAVTFGARYTTLEVVNEIN